MSFKNIIQLLVAVGITLILPSLHASPTRPKPPIITFLNDNQIEDNQIEDNQIEDNQIEDNQNVTCLLYTSPSPRD